MRKIVRGAARRVLAIGADSGDGTLAPEDALAPDGRMILIEHDRMRAEETKQRLASRGLDGRATVIAGDPRRLLHKLAGPFDVIFAGDADQSVRDKLVTLLTPDGILIAHDTK